MSKQQQTAHKSHSTFSRLTFRATGQASEHRTKYTYDPFGNLLRKGGELADANTVRFSSKEYHVRSGLYYYGFRFYDPNLQRWLNQDPIGERGGINLYGFVENDPLNSNDPFGLDVYQYDEGQGPAALWMGPASYVYGETALEQYVEAPLVNAVSALVNIPSALGGFSDWVADRFGLTDLAGRSPTEVLSGLNPMMAYEWQASRTAKRCEAAKTEAALVRVGDRLTTVNDVLRNPNLLAGKGPAEIQAILGKTPGWQIEKLGQGSHAGQGWVLREYTSAGNPTGRMLRWHPGGGHHGPNPYWRVTGGPDGKSGIIPGGAEP